MFKKLLLELCRTMLPLNNPGTDEIIQQVTSTTQQFVSPVDGYAVVIAGDLNSIQALNLSNGGVQSFIPTYINAWGSTWVPCRKGQIISLTINGTAFPSIRFVENQVYAME